MLQDTLTMMDSGYEEDDEEPIYYEDDDDELIDYEPRFRIIEKELPDELPRGMSITDYLEDDDD